MGDALREKTGAAAFRTTSGLVRGSRSRDGVTAVLGIPYAAAPFGPRPFPRAAASWTWARRGTATAFRTHRAAVGGLPGSPGWRAGDEDVLSVNVWAPTPSEAGPCRCCSGFTAAPTPSAPPPSPTSTAPRSPVPERSWSCNYRVGFEGFGHVPGFPDNRGLLDQMAALRWVRDNIAAFGGDPARVTVAGHSAGAGSIVCLMAREETRGLFRRAVVHSAPRAFFPPATAAAVSRRIAAEAGVAPTGEGLLSASPHRLVAASDSVAGQLRDDPVAALQAYDPVVFQPVVDGDVLPADPLSALDTGVARDVDLLVCHTEEECWFLHAVGGVREISSETELAGLARALGLPGPLLDGYRALMPEAPLLDRYLALFGDAVFGEYSRRLAEHHVRAGGRAHASRFARRRRKPGGEARPWHTADIPFALATWTRPAPPSSSAAPPTNRTAPCPGASCAPGRASPPTGTRVGPRSPPAPHR